MREYIKAVEETRSPIALSVDLTEEMQMAGWLYWRIYETKFNKSDFHKRFNQSFDKKFGLQVKMLNMMGFLTSNNGEISLSDKGTYWIHAFEDFFAINYINKLWGASKTNPWPEKVVL